MSLRERNAQWIVDGIPGRSDVEINWAWACGCPLQIGLGLTLGSEVDFGQRPKSENQLQLCFVDSSFLAAEPCFCHLFYSHFQTRVKEIVRLESETGKIDGSKGDGFVLPARVNGTALESMASRIRSAALWAGKGEPALELIRGAAAGMSSERNAAWFLVGVGGRDDWWSSSGHGSGFEKIGGMDRARARLGRGETRVSGELD